MTLPTWIGPALEIAVDLGKMVAEAIANRKKEAEEARVATVPKLRALADFLEKHEEREEADAVAAVKEATSEVMREKAASTAAAVPDDVMGPNPFTDS